MHYTVPCIMRTTCFFAMAATDVYSSGPCWAGAALQGKVLQKNGTQSLSRRQAEHPNRQFVGRFVVRMALRLYVLPRVTCPLCSLVGGGGCHFGRAPPGGGGGGRGYRRLLLFKGRLVWGGGVKAIPGCLCPPVCAAFPAASPGVRLQCPARLLTAPRPPRWRWRAGDTAVPVCVLAGENHPLCRGPSHPDPLVLARARVQWQGGGAWAVMYSNGRTPQEEGVLPPPPPLDPPSSPSNV